MRSVALTPPPIVKVLFNWSTVSVLLIEKVNSESETISMLSGSIVMSAISISTGLIEENPDPSTVTSEPLVIRVGITLVIV